MPKTVIEFGEWVPDGGPINNPGMWFVRNALKVTDDYENFPSFGTINTGPNSGADAPIGTHYHIKRVGKKPLIFWGTATKVYVAEEEDDLSGETWYDATGTSGPYTATRWDYVSFGPTVIATNGTDPIQGYTVADTFDSAANFADLLVTTGPTSADIKPKHLAVYKNHVFAANITMGANYGTQFVSGTLYPELVWWSDTDNATRFGDLLNSPKIKGSGWFLLYDGNGEITGMAVGGDVLYVFKEKAVYRCDGFPFTFTKVSDGIGTTHSDSIVVLNGEVFFWSDVGPCKVDGDGRVIRLGIDSCYRSIGDGFSNKFPSIIDTTETFTIEQSGTVYAAPDPVNELVVFFVDTADDDLSNGGSGAATMLVYNNRREKFYYGELPSSTATLNFSAAALYPFRSNKDTGSLFTGIRLPIGYGGSTYRLASFSSAYLFGGDRLSYFRTPFLRFGDGASRITKVRVLSSFLSSSTNLPEITVSIITRQQFALSPQVDVQDPVVSSTGSKAGWIDVASAKAGIAHSIGIALTNDGAQATTCSFRDIAGIEVEYAELGVRGA